MTEHARFRDVLARGFAGALLLRLLGAGMAFGTHVLLARLLGYASYGTYVYALTAMVTLSMVLKLGFDAATLRFAPAYRADGEWGLLRGLFRESGRLVWTAAGVAAIAIAALVALARPGDDPVLAWTFWIACVALPLMTVQHLAEARLRAFERVTLSRVAPELLQPLLLILLVLGVALLPEAAGGSGALGARSAMLCTVGACGFTLVFSTLALRRVAPSQAFRGPARHDSRVWRRVSFQLTFYSTTMLVIGQIDVVVAGALLGPEAAGGYATASRISKFVPFGLTAANLALAPLAARLFHAGKTRELQRVVVWAAVAILVTTLPLGVAAIVFRESLLGLFGTEFLAAGNALAVLAIGRMANALCGPTGTLLTMSGNQRDAAVVAVGSGLLDGLLLIVLVPALGMLGAAVATTATITAWNLAQLVLVRRRTGIDPTALALLRSRHRDPVS
jgi:O-antigen/teichoic acid export membrane protein